MDTLLQDVFKTLLKSLTGFNFQDVVSKLFVFKYGETGFTPIRPHKDKGCDGIIESEKRIIACYGPEENRDSKRHYREFEKKIKSDFNLYKTNWQKKYPNWSVVINHQISPEYDNIVKKLTDNGSIIGIDQLLVMIDNLKHYQRRKLGEKLGIRKEYLTQDYLAEFLEDLLSEPEISKENIKYDKDTYINITQKIELNYNEIDIDAANSEFGFFASEGYLNLIDNLMSAYEDEEINKIKSRIIGDYLNKSVGNNFKEKIQGLSEIYIERYSSINDDDYRHYIRALLIYLFEQCLIGKKPGEEHDTSTS